MGHKWIHTLVFTLLSCLILSACYYCKAILTSEQIYSNNSNHFIIVIPYSNGVAINTKSKAFEPFQKIGGFLFDTLKVDSVHVLYDNMYSATHYNWNMPKFDNNPRAIKFDSTRCVFSSFVVTEHKVGKCGYHTISTYTFTEQDYLDAQK